MLNICSTRAEEAARAKYFLASYRFKVQGNGPQQSFKTEVCCWFLPVLVLSNRQFSQMTGKKLSAMASLEGEKRLFFQDELRVPSRLS